MNVFNVSGDEFGKLNQKYQRLSDYNDFRELILEYINELNPNTDHDWINYITYYENNNEIFVYFKKFQIYVLKNNENITKNRIGQLFENVISTIKIKNIYLPISYLADIINIDNVNNLLLKRSDEYKIQIYFKIVGDKIKFFVKYFEFFECKINDSNILINDIYKEYIKIENNKKKLIFLITSSTFFNCEDTLHELQKFMFDNNYWLDICFLYNENNFQNSCKLSTYLFYFIKYDIILLYDTFLILDNINFDTIKNKLIIVIPTTLTPDRLAMPFRKNTDFKNLKNNIIYWGKKNLESIEISIMQKTLEQCCNTLFISYKEHLNRSVNLSNNKILNLNLNTKSMNILKPNTDILNNNILEKKDFFKLYDFDINKKLITIFIRWPKCTFEDETFKHYNTMREIYSKHSFIDNIINNLKNDYNILFKAHPAYFKPVNNNYYFNNNSNKKYDKCTYGQHEDKLTVSFDINNDDCLWFKEDNLIKKKSNKLIFTEIQYSDIGKYYLLCNKKKYVFEIKIIKNDDSLDISKCNSYNSYLFINNGQMKYKWEHKEYPGLRLLDKYKFFTENYTNELFKYTNFSIMFMPSTTILDCNLYNIPCLLISLKDTSKDWFNLHKYYFENLSKDEKNELSKIYNNIDIFNKNILIDGFENLCGERKYYEDIKDNISSNFKNIIEKEEEYKNKFLKIKNNPYFDTSHITSQIKVGAEILEIIDKCKYFDVKNDIKYNICKESITIYEKAYIDVFIENNIITMKILKCPYKDEKLLSYGFHIYTYNIEPKCTINLSFDIKINIDEENVNLKLYTGIKWITYNEKINNTYSNYNINEKFDLSNRSKWRISTTSKKNGQEIIIKSLHMS